jgi:hypothetical protein
VQQLTTITAETVVPGDPAAVERLLTSPSGWRLWPGVEAVEAAGDRAFELRQTLDLPFFGAETRTFRVVIDELDRDQRTLAVLCHTEGWQFERRGQWHARLLRTRSRLTQVLDDALDDERFEHARNVYRATSIWPMRHGHNEVLRLLTLDFLRDKLLADGGVFLRAARRRLEQSSRKE